MFYSNEIPRFTNGNIETKESKNNGVNDSAARSSDSGSVTHSLTTLSLTTLNIKTTIMTSRSMMQFI
jgi:hypothetical protein